MYAILDTLSKKGRPFWLLRLRILQYLCSRQSTTISYFPFPPSDLFHNFSFCKMGLDKVGIAVEGEGRHTSTWISPSPSTSNHITNWHRARKLICTCSPPLILPCVGSMIQYKDQGGGLVPLSPKGGHRHLAVEHQPPYEISRNKKSVNCSLSKEWSSAKINSHRQRNSSIWRANYTVYVVAKQGSLASHDLFRKGRVPLMKLMPCCIVPRGVFTLATPGLEEHFRSGGICVVVSMYDKY